MIDKFEFRKPSDEVQKDPPEELIPGFIDQGLIILAAKPTAGKTFLAIKIGVHVATGEPWRGRDVTQGMVLYCLGEGTAFFSHRVTTACDDLLVSAEGMPFYTLPHSLNLMSGKGGKPSDDVVTLIEKIKELEAKCKHQCRLVVFDTLSRYMPAGDENNQEDASALINGCEHIRDNIGCSIMLLHHMRKDQKEVRGSTVLTGAVDQVVLNKMWGEKMVSGPVLWSTELDGGKRKDREDANEWTMAKMRYMSNGELWFVETEEFKEVDGNYDVEGEYFFKNDKGECMFMPVLQLIDEPTDPVALTELTADAKRVAEVIRANGPMGVRQIMRHAKMSQNKLYKILDVLESRSAVTRDKDKKYSCPGSNF